jgi:hypothetical protein
MRRDDRLTLDRVGDTLIVNGMPCDFSSLSEGDAQDAETTGCPWFAEPVRRENGRLHVCLFLPHGPGAAHRTLFPLPVSMAGDGPVPVPEPG